VQVTSPRSVELGLAAKERDLESYGIKVPKVCKLIHSSTDEFLSYPVKKMQFTKVLQEMGQLAADLQKFIELER
jgi:hypothetical protein